MARVRFVLMILLIALLPTAPAAADSAYFSNAVLVPDRSGAASLSAGDFVAALAADVTGLDPAGATDGESILVVSQIYETLVAYRLADSFPVPGLAQSWTVSSDGLTWIFNLRPGIKFHDGTDLDAAAVVFNIERWWDEGNAYHVGDFVYFEGLFGGFKGDADCLINAVKALGTTQVQIVLRQRASILPTLLAVPAFGIASPAAIVAGLADHPVGSGPFSFVERTAGDHIRLAANTSYWGNAPRVAGLYFRVISDPTARFDALKSGAVHSAEGYAPGAAADPDLQPLARPSLNVGYLGINPGRTHLSNPLVRQAIAHAINRPALIAATYGSGAQLAQQFLPESVWGFDPTLTTYTYDPELAKSLLAQVGYTTGFTTTLTYRNVARAYLPHPAATALAIQADLAAVGIDAGVIEMPSRDFLDMVYAGNADLFLLGWGAYYPHPANFLTYHFCGGNFSLGPYDDDLCAALAAAEIDPNLYSQWTRYRWAAGRVHSTVPALPLVHTTSSVTTRWDVQGLALSGYGADVYRDVFFGGAETPVDPAVGGTLVYTDTAGSPTTVAVPAGAVTGTVTLRLLAAGDMSAPPDLGASGHAFDLSAYQVGVRLEGLSFDQPVTITVGYTDADIARVYEGTLAIYFWDGAGWVDAATTCSPALPYVVDYAANRIGVPVCHLSRYALYGEKRPVLYLPMIVRAGS